MLHPSFSGSVFLTTLFLSAVTLPHSQPRDRVNLELSLEVPSSVDDVGDFIIKGTLKSDATKDIKVVADPDGILFDYFPPNALNFEKESDEKTKSDEQTKPDFVGGLAKWKIDTYLTFPSKTPNSDTKGEGSQSGSNRGSSPGSSDSTSDDGSQPSEADSSKTSTGSFQGEKKVYPPDTTQDVPAGKSIDVKYNVGKGYDFTRSGAGTYTVKLSRDFFWVLVDDVLTEVKVDVKSSTVSIKGKLAGKSPETRGMKVDKRARGTLKTIGCEPEITFLLEDAADIANKLVAASQKSLADTEAGGDRKVYQRWFGDWDAKATLTQSYRPRKQVQDMFTKGIRPFNVGGDQGGYTYDCNCEKTIMAWVSIQADNSAPKEPIINICDGFHHQDIRMSGGFDTKAGTLIHEATHFPFVRPRATHHARGPVKASELSSKPFLAIENADSYEYFAEEYFLTDFYDNNSS